MATPISVDCVDPDLSRYDGTESRAMTARILKIIGVNALVLLGLLLLLEAVGQIVAIVRPSYDVLFLQPDKAVGWKQVPDFRFTWAGYDWYAAEFSVDIETNPLGFRDLVREPATPQAVTRVAVLGDSFIEAAQVPLHKTATQLLEQRLNAALERVPGRSQKWEVLNFGVSNHGVGQYLLMWEEYASKFRPDYVAIFVAKFHMRRTISKYEYRAFTATKSERLWVRPTFRIENGSLVREPAPDFDKFVRAQEDLTKFEFDGSRSRRKPTRLLTLHYARLMWGELKILVSRADQDQTRTPKILPGAESELVALNLKIIEELGLSVSSAGGKLVVVDASRYFKDDESVSRELGELCVKHGFGYVPVYQELLKANANGIATRWNFDTHFNEAGNMILASALYDWIARNALAAKSQ